MTVISHYREVLEEILSIETKGALGIPKDQPRPGIGLVLEQRVG